MKTASSQCLACSNLTLIIIPRGCTFLLGGGEFIVFYENAGTSREAVSGLIEQIKEVTSEPIVTQGQGLHLTASIGVACFPEDGTSLDTLTRNADMAMYSEKQR